MAEAAAGKTTFHEARLDSLPSRDRSTSVFEFWPAWVMYAPVVLQWLYLSIRHRSLTLPLIANPALPLSGMVGVSKHLLLRQADGLCAKAILPWIIWTVSTESAESQARACILRAQSEGISVPFVCKPDIGCRGAGVKLVEMADQLASIIAQYPSGASFLIQKLASWVPEAGIFFVSSPGHRDGEIVSLTFKYTPYVSGNGVLTVGELVAQDPRAGSLQHLYYERNKDHWHRVLPKDEQFRLVFSASHCRGAVFRDAREYITPELTARIADFFSGLPDFYYGRLDVKFPDLASLRAGENMQILEINGASAEAIHIWDRDASFMGAIKTLLWQYRTLFRLGAIQRERGHRPPGIAAFLAHWLKERRLTRYYPATD